MCGVVGIVSKGGKDLLSLVERMQHGVAHRGPDGSGNWKNEGGHVAFGHHRLSIIDVSNAGAQPMPSASGRYVITYNGEIYNFEELRAQLPGQSFRGHSDTEVLVEAIEYWGLEGALKRCNGMFSLGVFDKQQGVLSIARDRMGIKPMYFGWWDDCFVFCSELKALFQLPGFQLPLNYDAISMYLRLSYIPTPLTVFEGLYKLEAGTHLSASLDVLLDQSSVSAVKNSTHCDISPSEYWSLRSVVRDAYCDRQIQSYDLCKQNFKSALLTSVERRMIADVPLGAFLSGGVDSSTIVACMQEVSSSPVKSFSIGFEDSEYNEANYAKAVAQHLGVDHTELYVSAQKAMNVVPKLPAMYDEPFADVSQIPTFLVSELARQQVTVSVTGDGGDELFCGYNRYMAGPAIWAKLSVLPASFRPVLGALLRMIPGQALDVVGQLLQPVLPKYARLKNFGDKLHKLSAALGSKNLLELNYLMVSQWENPDALLKSGRDCREDFLSKAENDFLDETSSLMLLDLLTYLSDGLLTKTDRASMAVALEVRVPFLDHEVIEQAWRIPTNYKVKDGEGKLLLKDILYDFVPKELVDRPKMGFGVPFEHWIRSSLKDWSESILFDDEAKSLDVFDEQAIQRRWTEHLSGEKDHAQSLWNVLMFNAWAREYAAHIVK